jgi:hypothetical protein
MKRLHEPILMLAQSALANVRGNVLDLGCGNACLLAGVCGNRDDLVPFGIDSNSAAIAHAKKLLPMFANNFSCGDLFELENWGCDSRRYALTIVMLGRLLEVPSEQAHGLLAHLQKYCSQVLWYAYPDWDEQALPTILDRFGLEIEIASKTDRGIFQLIKADNAA